jgi:hypothetical protein
MTVRPSIMLLAKSTLWCRIDGARGPYWETREIASVVIRARGGDSGARRRGVHHEDERLAQVLDQFHRGADRPEVMGARAGWDDHQVGEADEIADPGGQRRRGGAQAFEGLRQVVEPGLHEMGSFGRPQVPPIREAALGIGIDQGDRTGTAHLGLHGEVTGEGGLAGTSFA